MDGAIEIKPFQLAWMIGEEQPRPAPAALFGALREVRIAVPDAGVASFEARLDPGAPFGALEGQRVVFTAVFGIVPHALFDGVVLEVERGADGLVARGEDLSVLLDGLPRFRSHEGPLHEVARAVLEGAELPGCAVEVIAPRAVVAMPPGGWVQQGTDREFVTALGMASGNVLTVRPGKLPLSNVVRFAPLAMVRTDVAPLHPEHLLRHRAFSPAPGVQVVEAALVASGERRLVVGGVHELAGLGEADGRYYVQHLTHEIAGERLVQEGVLVRL